ncbi:chymotrypsin inhibitor-like [Zeugodacus cucurbitae]|uniref:chymotrypsin inhibitor-like n=1 Tax=Zeugodacus cucurbitae TaxID=28588 RepID=UPI0023D8ED62|nr:chymotrypsin inhibitor-like [Zeugodacus cucurbitae]
MYTKFCLLLLLVVCIAGFGSAKPQLALGICGENEVFTNCGTLCPQRCEERSPLLGCILLCYVGCQCQPGYVLNNEERCVLPEECRLTP